LKQSKAIEPAFAKGRPNSIPQYWAVETIDDYLAALASEKPTPGGGSAATIVAALGAALVAMVARITLANAKMIERHDLAQQLVARADALRSELHAARQNDERAYAQVVAAMQQPRETSEQKAARSAALQAALREAAAAPLHAAALSLRTLELAERSLALENSNLSSDIGCAAEFATSALEASALNVRINHKFLQDHALVAAQERELCAYEKDAAAARERVRVALSSL